MDDAATTGEWSSEFEGDARTRNDPDTPVEHKFLLRLRDEPNDLAMRMVFADWLEQTAQTEKAEVVRLLAEVPVEDSPGMTRLRLLGTTLDREWMAIVSRAPIDKCPTANLQFRYQCPTSWESLRSTDDATVRFCDQCQKHVYFCSTVEEVRQRGEAKACVAFSPRLRRQDALAEYDHGGDDGWDAITDDYGADVLMGEVADPGEMISVITPPDGPPGSVVTDELDDGPTR